MLAGMAAGRINAALGLEESAAAIFRHRTVETLAEALSNKAVTDRPVPVGPVIPRNPYTAEQKTMQGVPLSPKQQYWLDLVQQLRGEYPSFHIPIAVNLTGSINRGHMQAALDLLADRHESLRLQIRQGLQVVNPCRPGQLVLRSATGPGVAGGMGDLAANKAWLGENLSHLLLDPFDLAVAPLARAALLQVSASTSVLVIVMHHLVGDGFSVGILLADLMAAYNAAVQTPPGQQVAMRGGELPLQHTAYSAWMHASLRDGILAPKVAYWEKRLKGGRLLQLPSDPSAPRNGPRSTTFADVHVSADGARAVSEFAVNMGTSTFVVVMAAFQVKSLTVSCAYL